MARTKESRNVPFRGFEGLVKAVKPGFSKARMVSNWAGMVFRWFWEVQRMSS